MTPTPRAARLGLIWVALFATGIVVAQEESRVSLNGQIDLVRIVDLAAERLGLNVEYDASQLRGSVTFRLGEPIDDNELWALTNRLLAARGFTTIRRAGEDTVGVVPLNEAAGLTRIEFGVGTAADPSAGYRALVIRPRHTEPGKLAAALKAMSSSRGATVSRIAETDLLMIADLTPRVEQILGLLDDLDSEDSSIVIETVELTSTLPDRLIPQMTQLVAKRQLAGAVKLEGELLAGSGARELIVVAARKSLPTWLELIRTLDRAEGSDTRTYRPRYFALAEVARLIDQLLAAERGTADTTQAWRVVENTLTGSLVITATPSQHSRIESLLEELAAAPPESRRSLRSFVIRNRDAGEMRRLLDELLREGVLEEIGQAPAELGPESIPGTRSLLAHPDRERRLRLTIDEGTNTLIAAGEPRLLDQVADLLKRLDIRRPQVMVEVLLISLTESQTLDLGVELQQIVSDSGTLVALGSLFGLSSLSPFSGGISGLPGGGSAVVLDPGNFSAVVRALETINKGRSLSMPRVLVNDNESASINSVVQEPFVSVNASDTVATTSFGGFESAGTTVSITPQIAEGDHLALQYAITLSSFTGESADAAIPPPRQQNTISSVATIPDGYTIAVGGIELHSEGEAENRVPVLGSIPVLGEFFKTQSHSGSKTRFYAFIRANVLRSDSFSDLLHFSDSMRRGVDLRDDEPVLLPRIIR